MEKYTPQDTFDRLKKVKLNIDLVDLASLTFEDIYKSDYPDFSDVYVSYAKFKNGKELNEDQLEELNEDYYDLVYEIASSTIW